MRHYRDIINENDRLSRAARHVIVQLAYIK